MKILTDEQIAKTIQESLGEEAIDLKDYDWMVTPQDKAIAQAQLDQDKADAEAMVEMVTNRWRTGKPINFEFIVALKSKYLKE